MKQLFGLPEQWWLYLDQFGILLGDITLAVAIPGGIIAFAKRDTIRRWLWRNRFPKVGELDGLQEDWDSLLFTVSNPILPEWVLSCVEPKTVALLATSHSMEAARAITAYAGDRGITVLPVALLSDPDDPAEARRRCKELLDGLRAAGSRRPAVDITGGKTPMSVGAFMAAEERGATSIYVTAPIDGNGLNTPKARIRAISTPNQR